MKTLAQLRRSVRQMVRETALFVADQTGTVAVAQGSAAVTGTATLFRSQFQVGDEIQIGAAIRTVAVIASDTALTAHRVYEGAATGVTPQLVQRQGGWTDEELDDQLNNAVHWVEGLVLRFAREALGAVVEADLVAGEDLVTVPEGMRRVSFVELWHSPDAWTRLRELRAIARRGAYGTAFPRPWGVAKGTGAPTAYCWRNAGQIELDLFPATAQEDGVRFWGESGLSALTDDDDTLTLAVDDEIEMPDGHMLDMALVGDASARCLAMTDTGRSRAESCRQQALADLKNWLIAHGGRGGRSNGVQAVRIVGGV